MHGLKSFTRMNSASLRWHGAVWMDESFDRIVRNDHEFAEKWNYIAQNAVKKGLATDAQKYRGFGMRRNSSWWSAMRSRQGRLCHQSPAITLFWASASM